MIPLSCRRRLIPTAIAAALVALTLVVPTSGATAVPPAAPGYGLTVATSVTIYGYGFVPQSVRITAGETVQWVNADSMTHTVTADDNTFDGELASGGRWSHTFPRPGTYSYHCTIHPQLRGTVTVS